MGIVPKAKVSNFHQKVLQTFNRQKIDSVLNYPEKNLFPLPTGLYPDEIREENQSELSKSYIVWSY
jgi:hypothetical protein